MSDFLDKIGGEQKGKINVQIGTSFLELFSGQLYTSPQKAFEELIVNGWDAGASHVDVWIPDDLDAEDASLMVIDNGESMDLEGLKKLWSIGLSDKKETPKRGQRSMIGKFGVGKLATYLLADHFSYVCRDKEGTIRRVTMNYEDAKGQNEEKYVDGLELDVYEIKEEDLKKELQGSSMGKEIINFIDGKIPQDNVYEDEYNCEDESFSPNSDGTWTLVILSNLKPKGKKLRKGTLANMLRAALPLGNTINIRVNGVSIKPKKGEIDPIKTWNLGSGEIGSFKVDVGGEEITIEVIPTEDGKGVKIPGIKGKITGKFTVYDKKISGGKSAQNLASNGFSVNVLGRVINQENDYFGTKNMHHGTWARFRCTVRADGMNDYLAVSREKFSETDETVIFRGFLMKLFNIARNHYESNDESSLKETEEVWIDLLSSISRQPLRHFINDVHEGKSELWELLIQAGKDVEPEGEHLVEQIEEWESNVSQGGEVVKEVKLQKLGASSNLVKYDISTNSIYINEDHPFVSERKMGRNEKVLLAKVISTVFLSDIYLRDRCIDDALLAEIIEYREQFFRSKAIINRESLVDVVNLLKKRQHETSDPDGFEDAVSSAFRCLGFNVTHKSGSGEPDGVALATWSFKHSQIDEEKKLVGKKQYGFVYEAKTSQSEQPVPTDRLHIDTMQSRHIPAYQVEYAICVAPDYQTKKADGSDAKLIDILSDHPDIVCLTTAQLISLLIVTGKHGAISHEKFREVFSLTVGEKIDEWIAGLEKELEAERASSLTIQSLLEVLKEMEGDSINEQQGCALDTIRYFMRNKKGLDVSAVQIRRLAQTLQAILPKHITFHGGKVHVHQNIDTVIDAVQKQSAALEELRTED